MSRLNSNKTQPKLSMVLIIASFLSVVTILIMAFSAHGHSQTKVQTPKAEYSKTVIAAVGDSITFGDGADEDKIGKDSYPSQLQTMLGDKYQVINYGVGGSTLLTTGDHPYKNEKFYTDSQRVNPGIILIMLGTNDSKPNNWDEAAYETQLKDFVESYKNLAGRPKIYLMSPPAAYQNEIEIQPKVIRERVLPIVKRVAASTRVSYIDIFGATKNRPDLFIDGVHPDSTGYKLIAQKVYGSIKPIQPYYQINSIMQK